MRKGRRILLIGAGKETNIPAPRNLLGMYSLNPIHGVCVEWEEQGTWLTCMYITSRGTEWMYLSE